ncbi:VOC family protein [Nonomuraea zeae]|uniref:VOC family protein n=1 Tax=Nonomuraea zeae TaxID=1642303 RepID=UPI00197F102D
MHILMFDSPDIARAAARLEANGVGHGGVQAAQRPVETADGVRMEPVRFLEIDGLGPGLVPEGRVGLAANSPASDAAAQTCDHPNGAVALVECVLCVAGGELDDVERRYERYLGRAAFGVAIVFRQAA